VRVGFVYNVRRIQPDPSGENDEEAEFDVPEVLDGIRGAIAGLGHDVVDLEATPQLPRLLASADVDVVFNVAEGSGSRSREAQVPALLEFLGIAYTGSDPVTLGLTLDKPLAKAVAAAAGVHVPDGFVMAAAEDPVPAESSFPLIVKPAHEGSSKGVGAASVVSGEDELRELVADRVARYRQPVLVEEYVTGREITVGLLGTPPRVLPAMEVLFAGSSAHTVYSFGMKQGLDPYDWEIPARLTTQERRELESAALTCFEAFGCRDVARFDFRLDAESRAYFLECNPLPGLMKGWSDICLVAEAAGIEYEELIGEILAGALRRQAARTARTL
jgi:D-alanine-D-alanine ligase